MVPRISSNTTQYDRRERDHIGGRSAISRASSPRNRWLAPAVLCGVLALASTAAAQWDARVPAQLRQPEVAGLTPLFPKITRVPEQYHNQESGYTACEIGPDGKLYIGTAYYYDYGYWLAYDPADGGISLAVDTKRAVAESRFDVHTQGKTHSNLAVGPDGLLYGGTKQGHELFRTRPEIGEQAGGYPGGHLIAYDPATGVSRTMGILRPQDGLMNGVVDYERRRIYFKTEPRTHFLIYDIDTQEVIDKGRVGTWSRYIDMDAEGNVWILNDERVTAYLAEPDELAEYAVAVEGEGPPYKKPYASVAGGRGMRVRNMKLYGGDLTQLQEFDLDRAAGGNVPMRYVCRAVPEPFERSSDIHTMLRDYKGRIYWSAQVDCEEGPKQLLVMRYDPASEQSECLGYVVDPALNERRPMAERPGEYQNHVNIQGSAMAEDGTLYLMATYPYYILEFPQLGAG